MVQDSVEELLLMGKVIRPHGLRGLLRVRSYAQTIQSFLRAGEIHLQSVSGRKQTYRILSVQPLHDVFLLKLEGLNTFSEAEQYKGGAVYIERGALDPKDQEEYYWDEIIGLRVYSLEGRYIGSVARIFHTGGHDVYVVKQGDREQLIPAVHAVVKAISLKEKKMTIAVTEDLLGLNEI